MVDVSSQGDRERARSNGTSWTLQPIPTRELVISSAFPRTPRDVGPILFRCLVAFHNDDVHTLMSYEGDVYSCSFYTLEGYRL